MKRPDSFLTNTTAPTGRAEGAAKNNPGDNSGSGMDKEIYNDPAYAAIAVIQSYKDGGISDSDETTDDSDLRDAIEELIDKAVTDSGTPANSIELWDDTENYNTLGKIVFRFGIEYVNILTTSNLNKPPETNPQFWHAIPSRITLETHFNHGDAPMGGLKNMDDVNHAAYLNWTPYGRYRQGANGDSFVNYYKLNLDGSVVTGDSDLENILDVGGGEEYWNLDLIAPDNLGTRTLIDHKGRVQAAQDTTGGLRDTLAEVLDDAMQRITATTGPGAGVRGSNTGGGAISIGSDSSPGNVYTSGGSSGFVMDFDSANSTSPNTAKTDDEWTHDKSVTFGVPAVILKKAV
jgi:hypothetical protein